MKIGKSFGCKDSGEIFVVQSTVDYLKPLKKAWHEFYKLILHVSPSISLDTKIKIALKIILIKIGLK